MRQMTPELAERINEIVKRIATTQVERADGRKYVVAVTFDADLVRSVFHSDKDEALIHYMAQEIALYTATALLDLMKSKGDRK